LWGLFFDKSQWGAIKSKIDKNGPKKSRTVDFFHAPKCVKK
jgi:hypothetical protein